MKRKGKERSIMAKVGRELKQLIGEEKKLRP